MIEPMRKKEPKRFLDASLVPLERALLERADVLAELGSRANDKSSVPVQELYHPYQVMAMEFRSLAEELHHW